MLKAIIRNGAIVPLGPLPSAWGDGTELSVEAIREESMTAEEISLSFEQLEKLCAAGSESDFQRLEAAIEEMDRQEKARVRREWGLAE
jgi:hypothetical protein